MQFKAFKPEGLNKIAGAMGYKGDMSKFQDFIEQDPARMARMNMFTQAAQQMARGGVVRMQTGGTITPGGGSGGIIDPATSGQDGAGALSNVVEDTSPQLGGNLDMNGADIVTTSNADLELAPNGTGHVTVKGNDNPGTIQFNCEQNSHGVQLKGPAHSAGSSAVLTLPTATGNLIGSGDTGTLPLAAMDIDGGTDIGADLTTSDLIVVDDGAGGTNRKAALSRLTTFMTGQGFSTDDPTALAIALG